MLRLCNDLSFIMNHRKDLKYCMINMKVDKAYRAIDDTMKKDCFLNKIWLKLCRNNSKFKFILTILKTHKNETMLIISHFSEILMCVKRVSRYFIILFMFITSRFVISSRKLLSVWYFYMIWWILIKFLWAIVKVFDLKRIIIMYYDFDLQCKHQKEIFINYRNLNAKELLH